VTAKATAAETCRYETNVKSTGPKMSLYKSQKPQDAEAVALRYRWVKILPAHNFAFFLGAGVFDFFGFGVGQLL
jgi:hypothetical protein